MEREKRDWDRTLADSKQLIDRIWDRGEISIADLRYASGLASELLLLASELTEHLQEILPIGPQVVDQLTYEEASSYFVDDRPEDPRVVKGAMLLEDDAKGRLFTQVFLDEDNNLVSGPNSKPYGRRLVVRNLDAELQETFGGNNLVIVE